jgi:hypothetical protein
MNVAPLPKGKVTFPARILLGASLLWCCGCTGKDVVVQAYPDMYEVGKVRSELATPVVDEAIRLKPKTVLIEACNATPPSRVHQFRDELVARSRAKIFLTFMSADRCPS